MGPRDFKHPSPPLHLPLDLAPASHFEEVDEQGDQGGGSGGREDGGGEGEYEGNEQGVRTEGYAAGEF
jgi:hypothetical protein